MVKTSTPLPSKEGRRTFTNLARPSLNHDLARGLAKSNEIPGGLRHEAPTGIRPHHVTPLSPPFPWHRKLQSGDDTSLLRRIDSARPGTRSTCIFRLGLPRVLACGQIMLVALVNNVRAADQQLVNRTNAGCILTLVGHRMQYIAHGVKPGALLVVGFHDGPRRVAVSVWKNIASLARV